MADKLTPQQRSYNMSRIRSKDTKPEMLVRKFLHANGFRFRLHGGKPTVAKAFVGKPDIILPKYKTLIFVHGCFWHGHKFCKYFTLPKTNTLWWLDKINRNRENDKKAVKMLKKEGFKVIIVWECALKKEKIARTFNNLLKKLANDNKN
jgi:DNA mismatch endonuclease (patch repair protein)